MDEDVIRIKYEALSPELTERSRRLWAAAEAMSLGRGGMAAVSRATGMLPGRIARGIKELESGQGLELGRSRRPGGGRKSTTE